MHRLDRLSPGNFKKSVMRPILTLASTAVLCTLAAACGEQSLAFGDANSIIVAIPNELWESTQDDIKSTLEPRVYTVADEKAFTVTQVDPRDPVWSNMSKFKQVLLIGSENDPWVQQALDEWSGEDALSPPEIAQVHDVWARSQLVTIALLNDGEPLPQLQRLLPELAVLYDGQYRDYVVQKMFLSGADSLLSRSLLESAGFTLKIPAVYEWTETDDVHVFRNDNPDPSELIRQIAVAWTSPVPEDVGPESLLEWRAELVEKYYEDEQVVNLMEVEGGPGDFGGRNAYQIQASWQNPPGGWPAGGPFIMRAIVCEDQDRMYLLDAWLYAPGKEKYEYMIQLETILDSFSC